MFGSFGWIELLLILTIILVVFGAGKLPLLGEGFGKAVHGFKRTIREDETPPPPPGEATNIAAKPDTADAGFRREATRNHQQ